MKRSINQSLMVRSVQRENYKEHAWGKKTVKRAWRRLLIFASDYGGHRQMARLGTWKHLSIR
ncbi:hypothetical protein SAMN00768000_1254 [Sulfobacillus thermosulfidooxidans DSM 9293]|uniref:Uncharacterized protein n=1 Tax=Sulfobacillus thermosulfidooxidans (strain DSM 9293 / VKM B-1269 / AT-1) TaxID=929705 RepID=A0A1W1WC49_SULTA|nr:hypothetical protein SAMN00768000_1254 [Sulfobacillus thermosulfidooxidans DSM 9293]